MDYTKVNASTIDQWVEEGWEWGIPIDHQTFQEALNGRWQILLSPTKPMPKEWIGNVKGKKLLGLASGGGQQMPIFTALGAECTVLDYSGRQLEAERMVADREGYSIKMVQADMTKSLPFESESFDIIFHPISNCYVEDVEHIWKECYRILKPKGVLIAGLDNGMNFLFDEEERCLKYPLPFNSLRNPDYQKLMLENNGGYQFSHSIEEQIGGQLRAGFQLTDIYHDTNGSGNLAAFKVPTFFCTRSIKSH